MSFEELLADVVRKVVREEVGKSQPATMVRRALKRADAAKAMGISATKLDELIRAGKVATAEDAHLVPLSEVDRYCRPKPKRHVKRGIGSRARTKRLLEEQSDEAWDAMDERLQTKRVR